MASACQPMVHRGLEPEQHNCLAEGECGARALHRSHMHMPRRASRWLASSSSMVQLCRPPRRPPDRGGRTSWKATSAIALATEVIGRRDRALDHDGHRSGQPIAGRGVELDLAQIFRYFRVWRRTDQARGLEEERARRQRCDSRPCTALDLSWHAPLNCSSPLHRSATRVHVSMHRSLTACLISHREAA